MKSYTQNQQNGKILLNPIFGFACEKCTGNLSQGGSKVKEGRVAFLTAVFWLVCTPRVTLTRPAHFGPGFVRLCGSHEVSLVTLIEKPYYKFF